MIENNEPKTNKSFSSGVTPDKESDILAASLLTLIITISKNISSLYANIMPLYSFNKLHNTEYIKYFYFLILGYIVFYIHMFFLQLYFF